MDHPSLAPRVLAHFTAALREEAGLQTLSAILKKGQLPGEWARLENASTLDGRESARAYAQLQSAFRLYYGRGARGVLMRTGEKLWLRLLSDSPLAITIRAAFVRAMPAALRMRPALGLLTRILAPTAGAMTLHSLDLDLLIVDRASPSTWEQTAASPVCFVTLGIIRECLHWADGRAYDVEERACRAAGAPQCEFKITIGKQP